jgi:peptidylprolyl isomerase
MAKRVRVPSRSFWARAGWMSIALLFVVTAFGIGLYSFWQSTHQSDQPEQPAQVSCQIGSVPGSTALAAPEVFKPEGDVTKLEATDLTVGTGETVKAGDCLQARYYGTLATTGTVFDENYTLTTSLKFQVGTGQVIPGWDQGLIGMKVGGERRLVIPSELAYGSQAAGQIPANSDLVFVVKLEQIVKK